MDSALAVEATKSQVNATSNIFTGVLKQKSVR